LWDEEQRLMVSFRSASRRERAVRIAASGSC
jgi:hypothetical protein